MKVIVVHISFYYSFVVVVTVVIGHITDFQSFGNCVSENEVVKTLKKLMGAIFSNVKGFLSAVSLKCLHDFLSDTPLLMVWRFDLVMLPARTLVKVSLSQKFQITLTWVEIWWKLYQCLVFDLLPKSKKYV